MKENRNYAGIDYGKLANSNRDMETGIRYGVINQNEVGQAWFDSSEAVYINHCPSCGEEIDQDLQDQIDSKEETFCPNCNEELDQDSFDFEEPQGFVYNQDGYVCEQSADDTDIFVTKSPYFTYCQFCSPCAPGAGYLMNPIKDGIKTYCFDFSWFEDYNPPYPVYDVKTGKQITKEDFINANYGNIQK